MFNNSKLQYINTIGFTLIEVIIAMSVVSISLITIIGSIMTLNYELNPSKGRVLASDIAKDVILSCKVVDDNNIAFNLQFSHGNKTHVYSIYDLISNKNPTFIFNNQGNYKKEIKQDSGSKYKHYEDGFFMVKLFIDKIKNEKIVSDYYYYYEKEMLKISVEITYPIYSNKINRHVNKFYSYIAK